MSLTYRLITKLGFAINVINSTTLSILTPGIRILYFFTVENDSKKSRNVRSLM